MIAVTKPQTNELWYGYIHNFYFIEIRLIVGEGGIEIFPQHYRGT